MIEKRAWIEALRARGIDKINDEPWVRTAMTHLAAGELKGMRQFSIQTLAKTLRALTRAQGDWSQLVPEYSKRGGLGKARVHPRVSEAIQRQVDALNADEGQPIVIEAVFDAVRCELQSYNVANASAPVDIPGSSTISRSLHKAFTAKEFSARNRGDRITRDLYRENSYPRDRAEYPLLISEYDDLNAGVFLIDERSSLPFGRAYITHGVCQNTDAALGFDISHEPRSYDSAMGAILDSLLPKDTNRPEFKNCKGNWFGHGTQGTILMDNASYNKSKSIEMQTDSMLIALAGAKPYGPTEKCSIEHFNAMVEQDMCKKLPGWCGDKDDPDGVSKGIATAALTVVAFKEHYVKWVVDVYSNKPGIDGLSPKQRWFKHFKQHTPSVRWGQEDISLLRLRPRRLTFRASGGLKRLNLVYNSDELIRLRKRFGHNAEMIVHIDRTNLTYVKVIHPDTRELLHVPCTTDFRYVDGLTEQQQTLFLRMARLRGIKNPDLNEMVEARRELRDMSRNALVSTKFSRRRFAKQTGEIPALTNNPTDKREATNPTKVEIVSRVITDLEWNIIQLEEVELDLEDDSWDGK